MVERSLHKDMIGDRLNTFIKLSLAAIAVLSICLLISCDDSSASDDGTFDFTLNVYYTGVISDGDFTITGAYPKDTGSMVYEGDLSVCEWVKKSSGGNRYVPVTADYPGIKYHVTTFGDGVNPVKGDFTSIEFSDSIVKINDSAFRGSSVSTFDVSGKIEKIGNYAFADCDSLITFIVADNILEIGEYCFSGCEKLEIITMSKSMTKISPYTFYQCPSLYYVGLSNSITEIGDYAFRECGISVISLPNTISTLGTGVFYGCNSLYDVNIPTSLTTLSEKTFFGCTGLKKITIHSLITTVGYGAFQNCWNLSDVTLEENILELSDYSFACCTSLKTIRLPETMKTLGNYAFYKSGLTSIALPESIMKSGEYVFTDCNDMQTIAVGNGAVAYLTTFAGKTFLNKSGVKMQSLSANSFYTYDEKQTAYRLSGDVAKICWSNSGNAGEVTKYYDYILSGTVPVYTGPEPVRYTDVGYSYVFSGWSPELTETYGNATYTAQFLSKPRSYTVTWMNGDEVYESSVCDYGSKIIPPSTNPTKPATETTTYKFLRWNGYIDGLTVEGDTSFFAEYVEISTGGEKKDPGEDQNNIVYIAIAVAAVLLISVLIFRMRR